jgi:hypothetical protein
MQESLTICFLDAALVPMTTRFDIVKLRRFTFTMAGAGLIGVVMSTTLPPPPSRLSDMCHVDASGDVVIDKVAVGRVSQIEGTYFVEEPGANSTVLSRCYKGGCAPLQPDLLQGHVGAPVRAEFCGGHAARLTISGIDVFQLTQKYLDANAAAIHYRTVWMNRAGFLWCCFWLLMQTLAEIRAKRIGA